MAVTTVAHRTTPHARADATPRPRATSAEVRESRTAHRADDAAQPQPNATHRRQQPATRGACEHRRNTAAGAARTSEATRAPTPRAPQSRRRRGDDATAATAAPREQTPTDRRRQRHPHERRGVHAHRTPHQPPTPRGRRHRRHRRERRARPPRAAEPPTPRRRRHRRHRRAERANADGPPPSAPPARATRRARPPHAAPTTTTTRRQRDGHHRRHDAEACYGRACYGRATGTTAADDDANATADSRRPPKRRPPCECGARADPRTPRKRGSGHNADREDHACVDTQRRVHHEQKIQPHRRKRRCERRCDGAMRQAHSASHQ